MAREKWYSIQEAAEFLGISTVTLRRYIKDHKISAYRIAGKYRFKKKALQEFLEACKLRPARRTELSQKEGFTDDGDSPRNPQDLNSSGNLADEILKMVPHRPRALYIKAFTASRLGRHRDAEKYYRKILTIRPQDSAVYLFLGLLYQEMNKLDQALKMWREVVKMDKSSDMARVARYHITRALRAS